MATSRIWRMIRRGKMQATIDPIQSIQRTICQTNRWEAKVDLIEFIEYLDEIVDYEKIRNEYNLTYSEIAEHIQLLKDKASQPEESPRT